MIEADAGRGSVRSEAKIEAWLGHVNEDVAALEAEWTTNETREASLFGDAACWSPPARERPARLAALKRRQARLEQALVALRRRREDSARSGGTCKAIASTTDPDSRCTKDKEGRRKPNYNAQTSVDAGASGMIVACDVNDAPEDSGQLSPMLRQVQAHCGRKPEMASADSGYATGPELSFLEQEGIHGYLPDARESGAASARCPADVEALATSEAAVRAARDGQVLTEAQWAALPRDASKLLAKRVFVYDEQTDAYRCPAGHVLPLLTTSRDKRRWGTAIRKRYGFTRYGRAARPRGAVPCAACPRAAMCCRDPARGRRIERDQYEACRERMRVRMNCEEGRAVYKRRRETVEPRIGWLEHGFGLRRFMRRGLEQVRTEWSLACTAANVSILLRCREKVVGVL